MSSPIYSAELRPEPRLRRLVIASGVLLFLLGVLLIMELQVADHYKALIALAWLALSAFEWLSSRRAYARNGILRIDAEGQLETIEVFNGLGQMVVLENGLATGSTTLDISSLPAGVYTVQLKVDGNTITKRVVKK